MKGILKAEMFSFKKVHAFLAMETRNIIAVNMQKAAVATKAILLAYME